MIEAYSSHFEATICVSKFQSSYILLCEIHFLIALANWPRTILCRQRLSVTITEDERVVFPAFERDPRKLVLIIRDEWSVLPRAVVRTIRDVWRRRFRKLSTINWTLDIRSLECSELFPVCFRPRCDPVTIKLIHPQEGFAIRVSRVFRFE